MHSLLAKALQLDPENARAAYYEAALLRMENHAAEAAEKLERLSARFPRDRFVWNQLGECYLALHQTASARAAFEKTLEIDPDDITALYFLPQVYGNLGLPDVAAQTNIT
jgi:tetratricopeptide (TPR) repeat protein